MTSQNLKDQPTSFLLRFGLVSGALCGLAGVILQAASAHLVTADLSLHAAMLLSLHALVS